MADNSPGLHKKVKSIFDGVPVSQNGVRPPSYVSEEKNKVPQPDAAKEKDGQVSPGIANVHAELDHSAGNQKSTIVPHTAVPPTGTDSGRQNASVRKQQPVPEFSPPQAGPLQRLLAVIKAMKIYTPVKNTVQKWCRPLWLQISAKFLAPRPGVSPTRQKAMTILVPVLFIVFIFVFINLFSSPAGKTKKSPNVGPVAAVAAADKGICWQIPEPYPATLRDPMQFGSTVNNNNNYVETAALAVRGIVYSEDNPTAVIGTQIAHQGDTISGVTIVKINHDSVEFENNGKKWTQKVQR